MRDLFVGCIGIVLGAMLVVILVLFGMTFLNSSRPSFEPVAQPDRPDITITASGPFVSSQLQDAIKQSKLASLATVSLIPPNRFLVATVVTIGFAGRNVPVNTTETLSVRVVSGHAVLALDRVEVGGVDMPAEVVSPMVERMRVQSEDQLNRLISRNLQGTTLKLTNIRVVSDSVLIDLSAR